MKYLHTMDGYQVAELVRKENDTEDNYETESEAKDEHVGFLLEDCIVKKLKYYENECTLRHPCWHNTILAYVISYLHRKKIRDNIEGVLEGFPLLRSEFVRKSKNLSREGTILRTKIED